MKKAELIKQIKKKSSYLCIGLDTDIRKIPSHLLKEKDPVFAFNKQIIDTTYDLAVAYKPNIAFYESLGPAGWESLQKTIEYIPENIFTIADAKRGDIGNTSSMYAKAFFEQMNFDSITIAPYMGEDSVKPFLTFENKWAIVLGHTSNPGAMDFQKLKVTDNGHYLYEEVIVKNTEWGTSDQLMFVVGATRADVIAEIRKLVPDYFFLVPGVGAQGGSLRDVSINGFNQDCGLLVNSSRSIIYAANDTSFAQSAKKEAKKIQEEMQELLDIYW